MGLEDYNKKLPTSTGTGTPSNNFNRPPITPSTGDTSMQGWRGTTSYPSIMSGTSGVDWNTQYTNWSLDSSTSSVDKLTKAASIFGLVATGATTALAIGTGIAAITKNNKQTDAANFNKKERKEIKNNSEDTTQASSTLSSTINTAKNINDDTPISTMQNTATNLMTAVTNATAEKNKATQKRNTAEATKKTLQNDATSIQNEIDGYENTKTTATDQLEDLEKQDTSNMTDAQKTERQKAIDTLKKQNFSLLPSCRKY